MRSILFVPGDSEKKLAKAASVPADLLALDLEDSVTPDRKPEARERVQAYLRGCPGPRSQQLWVRINPLDTDESLQDLAAVMAGRPDGIIQPKILSLADLRRLSHYLDALEAHHGMDAGVTRIIA
ncbi:MAG: aldolase/citrate lyase family protein, partial [Salinisphaera sp.]|nr:aldolase/citrate lyase family protein [Salinisphaera sp.]